MVIRVAVVDDDEVVVRGVAAMLRPYAGQVEVIDRCRPDTRVDVALYDTFVVHARVRAGLSDLLHDPRIGDVVVYTWNFQPWMAQEAIGQGAGGYLSKGLTGPQLLRALREIHSGCPVVAPSAASQSRTGPSWPGREEGLTAREAEVLTLITMGLGNADLAERMGLSINSVKSYIRSCYRKIEAESRSQAVLWGVAHGLRTRRLVASGSFDEAQ